VTRPNIGDTVYYLSSADTYRYIMRGVVEKFAPGRGYHVSGCFLTIHEDDLYATEDEAKAARLAYYQREIEEAQRSLDNARARLSNAVGWLERARQEQE
jgi:hypothetical protein